MRAAGKFWVGQRLGGAFTAVFTAHTPMGARVVLRVFPSCEANVRAEILSAAERLSELRSQSVVAVLEAGALADGRAYVVEELVAAKSVRALCPANERLDTGHAAAIADQVLESLQEAHEAGLFHGGIVAPKLLWLPRGRIKLLGLGYGGARGLGNDDLPALGRTLFELLTGAPPRGLPLPSVAPAVPTSLASVIDRALASRPEHRWPDAKAMRDALRAAETALANEPDMNCERTLRLELPDGKGRPPRRRKTPSRSPLMYLPVAPANYTRVSAQAAAPKASLRPGQLFGRYRIEAKLGAGGMGDVYRATDTYLERAVALKVVRRDLWSEQERAHEGVARLLREARASAAVQHPNVVALYDAGEVDGETFLAMELVEGSTLRAVIMTERPPVAEAVRVLAAVARALGAAHAKGIVHRDIKPENVLISSDGAVKVADFGIARRIVEQEGDCAAITGKGLVIGSPRYMAPEQLRAQALDGRTDQFAWGVLAYELLTGKLPWPGASNIEIVSSILDGRIDRSRLSRLPERIGSVLLTALRMNPDERFAAMSTVAEQLELACGIPSPDPHAQARISWVLGDELVNPALETRTAERAMSTTRPRERSPLHPHARMTVLAAGVAVAALGLAVAVGARRREGGPAASWPAGAAPASSSIADAGTTLLILESVPTGAEVWEGKTRVGTTPFQVSIDRFVEPATRRRWIVRAPGFSPATVDQGHSQDPLVRTLIQLTPLPSPSVPPPDRPAATTTGSTEDARSDAPGAHPRTRLDVASAPSGAATSEELPSPLRPGRRPAKTPR